VSGWVRECIPKRGKLVHANECDRDVDRGTEKRLRAESRSVMSVL
jgi:hypothetical protein